MFDFRYHVVSLAAVFVALVLGILIGVAISGKGFVKDSERDVLNAQINDLRQQRDAASGLVNELQVRQEAAETILSRTYPTLMKDQLKGKRIAVLVIGPGGGGTTSDVEEALTDAGATELRYRAMKVPVDTGAITNALERRAALRPFAGERQLDSLGRELAAEFVSGGKTPLWDALARVLVERQRAGLDRAADGVVVIRAAGPQSGPTARFLAALYDGLSAVGVPVVGAESFDAKQSAVTAWRLAGLATVDDVDTLSGRLALALVLAGGRNGSYGLKETAKDGPVPQLAA
jgi:Copper transport outer membrane protein, MctB